MLRLRETPEPATVLARQIVAPHSLASG